MRERRFRSSLRLSTVDTDMHNALPTVAGGLQLEMISLQHETAGAGEKKGGEDDRGCASIKRGSGRGGLQTPRPASICLSSLCDVSNRSHRVLTSHIQIPPEIEDHTSSSIFSA